MKIVRYIGAVLAGVIVASFFMFGEEAIRQTVYPPPSGTNTQDVAQMKAFVATLPASSFMLALTGQLIGVFAATWLAARLARRANAGYITGFICLCALAALSVAWFRVGDPRRIVNAFMMPKPDWFSEAGLVIWIAATWVGARVGAERKLSNS